MTNQTPISPQSPKPSPSKPPFKLLTLVGMCVLVTGLAAGMYLIGTNLDPRRSAKETTPDTFIPTVTPAPVKIINQEYYDLNGDRFTDIVAQSDQNHYYVFYNNGDNASFAYVGSGSNTNWTLLKSTKKLQPIVPPNPAFTVDLNQLLNQSGAGHLSSPNTVLFTQTNDNNSVTSTLHLDLNLDGQEELVVGTYGYGILAPPYTGSSLVIAYNQAGDVLWQQTVNHFITLNNLAAGNLDDDPYPEIVVATQREGASDPSSLVVLEHDGTVKTGWPIEIPGIMFTEPTLTNVNGDGRLEIIVGFRETLTSTSLRAYDVNQNLLWSRTGVHNIITSSAVGDLNNDGTKEIVTSTFNQNPPWNASVMTTRLNGTDFGTTINLSDEAIHTTPIIGNIDNQGTTEILFASSVRSPDGGKVYAYSSTGSLKPGWPQSTGNNRLYRSGPSLADVDGDHNLEVFVNSTITNIYGWHHDGTTLNPHWPVGDPNNIGYGRGRPPLIGDIDNDNVYDLVIQSANCLITTINTATGSLNTIQLPNPPGQQCYEIDTINMSYDNRFLSVGASGGTSLGITYLLTNALNPVINPQWSMYQHDLQRTGNYLSSVLPTPTPSPICMINFNVKSLKLKPGQSQTLTATISSPSIPTFTVKFASSNPAVGTVNPLEDTIPPYTTTVRAFKIGSSTISASAHLTSNGNARPNCQTSIPLTVY